MAEYKGIWIFSEQENGIIAPCVFELLAKAKQLQAHNGEDITAVLLGSGVSSLSQELLERGADQVILCDEPALAFYSARPYEKALTALSEKYNPSIILYGATPIGRDLAPRLMVSLNTGLTADAIDLGYDEDGVFFQTTPGYGGKILAHIVILEARPQMATVHAGICEPLEKNPGASGKVIIETLGVESDPDYEVLETSEAKTEGPTLDKAGCIVAGGRGIKTEEDLAMLRELADFLNGQIASSRPLVDNGWLPHDRQIGQSGTTVKPDLMLNIGVSGSVQYELGMDKAKCIVAVNPDKNAPIFDIAHYGVAEDYRKFVPALIEELKNRKA